MKMTDFLKTWEGVQTENKWNRLVLGGLTTAVLLLSYKALTKETIVTLQPSTLQQEAWIGENKSSASYQEAWGLSLAIFLGNVTPGNAAFIKERLGPMLSADIYQDVMTAIDLQAQDINKDHVTIRFEPRYVELEPDSGKVFVSGNSFVRGVSQDRETRTETTFEFIIKIKQYLPTINYMTTYSGKPRTEKALRQMERREERKKEREHQDG